MTKFEVHRSVSPFLKRPRGSIKLSLEGNLYAEIDENGFLKGGECVMRVHRRHDRFTNIVVHPILNETIRLQTLALVNLQGHEVLYIGGIGFPYRVHLRMQAKMTLHQENDHLMIKNEDSLLIAKLYPVEDLSLQDLDLVARIEIEDVFDLESRDALLCGLAAWQFLNS